MNNINLIQSKELQPYEIREGVYGANFNQNGESLFLRMELLTEENTNCWRQFKEWSKRVANQDRGVLSNLVALAGTPKSPDYKEIKKITGFTEEEYKTFVEKAISLKNKTENKTVTLLKANSVGINHMYTGFDSGKRNYIAYISKNDGFSIQNITNKEFNLKNFIASYSDILISVGSDFSAEDSFHTRGISRNPHWVFEEKYKGLSILLHGFTGAVAQRYFPEKEWMIVRPVGSMQSIINMNLRQSEGFIEHDGKTIDITDLETSEDDPEGQINHIKIFALNRIYEQMHSN